MNSVFRAVYVVFENTHLGKWILRLWEASSGVDIPDDDPLQQFIEPGDLRGEVQAWGRRDPHITVTDAMTTCEPDEFDLKIKNICASFPQPVIEPTALSIFAKALVIRCSSPDLLAVRREIIEATRPLVHRTPVCDEEWQRCYWWIRQIHGIGKTADAHLREVDYARNVYIESGSPSLPGSRHFRVGFLLRMTKTARRLKNSEVASQQNLEHFLKKGEPHWYAGAGAPHVTIVSGLKFTEEAGKDRQLLHYQQTVWPHVQKTFTSYRPRALAIMGEDPDNPVEVSFFDWLTETFVRERRPGFKVLERIPFVDS